MSSSSSLSCSSTSSRQEDEQELAEARRSPQHRRRLRRRHVEGGDEEDEAEVTGLMSSETLERDGEDFDDEFDDTRMGSFRILSIAMGLVLLAATLAVLLPGIGSTSDSFEGLRTPARIPVEYDCPKELDHEADNYDLSFNEDYSEVTDAITQNMTEFLKTFREENFDNWGRSYEEVKAGMQPFKAKYYPPYLKDGDSIYESACGIGLNLFMTLEILQEVKGIENLFVYGNEYLENSASKANAVIDHLAPAHGRKGLICTGDSTELGFVPSEQFDLVYTGYISPLLDPLNFDLGSNINYQYYTDICKSADVDMDDWKSNKLAELQQKRQDDWYGKWVGEMARIAKPGVPVIVEQVSPRYCDAFFDWGGVNKEFWHYAASNNTYNWDVDPDSIVIEDDTLFRERYHVFMLKKGQREV